MPRIYKKYARRPRKVARRPRKARLAPARKRVDKKQNAAIRTLARDVKKLKAAPEVKVNPYQSVNAHAAGYITSGNVSGSTAPTVLTPGTTSSDISVGTLSVDRIGEKINIKSWYFWCRFQAKQNQFNSITYSYPIDFRIIVARPIARSPIDTTTPDYATFSTLFVYNSTTAVATIAPNNDYFRFRLPVQTNEWKVAYDKVHRIMPLTNPSTTGLSGATIEKWSLMRGVKSHVDLKLDLKKLIGSKLKYTTSNQPDNFKQWFVFHMAIPAGHDSTFDSTYIGTSFLEYQFIERMKFTDT